MHGRHDPSVLDSPWSGEELLGTLEPRVGLVAEDIVLLCKRAVQILLSTTRARPPQLDHRQSGTGSGESRTVSFARTQALHI